MANFRHSTAFNDALRSFRAGLSQEHDQKFQSATRKDVEQLAFKLQEDQKLRNSYVALGQLRPFIDGVQGYAKVIEVFCQTSEILTFVWGPIKFLLQITSTWEKALTKILDALAGVGDKLLIFEKCTAVVVEDIRFQPILVRVYKDLLELLGTAIRIFERNAARQFLEIHSPVFEKKLNTILSNLDNDHGLILAAVNVAHFNQALVFHQKAEAEFKAAASHRLYANLQTFRHELQPALLSTARLETARSISMQYPGSGNWLTRHPKFLAWKDFNMASETVLLLYGIPGAGKTTLSSLMYNELESELQMNPGKYTLAHLAMGFQSRQNNDCQTALRSLLFDQLAKYPTYAATILETLGGEYVQKLGVMEIVQELLKGILQFHRPVFLFIDGLDELSNDNEMRKFLGILEDFMRDCSDLRIFLSCRPKELIKLGVKKWSASAITISEVDNKRDVQSYVLHKNNLSFLTNDYGLDEEEASNYLKSIAKKSDGMFLYARLMIAELPNLLYGLSIENLIEELPRDIDQAYERSLQRIASLQKGLRKQAKRVFKFLLGGNGNLRVSELKQAILVSPNRRQFGGEPRLSLGLLCGSLIEIMNNDAVSLVHSSLKTYLLERDETLNLRQNAIQRSLASICFEYTRMESIKIEDSTSYSKLLLVGEYTFLSYACRNMIHHLRQGFSTINGTTIKGKTAMRLQDAIRKFHNAQEISTEESFGTEIDIQTDLAQSTNQTASYSPVAVSACDAFQDDQILEMIQADLLAIMGRFNTWLKKTVNQCDQSGKQSLIRLYGPPYRCNDDKCQNFYIGFDEQIDQLQHIASHKKYFLCSSETCPYRQLGFSSPEELRRHENTAHRGLSLKSESQHLKVASPQTLKSIRPKYKIKKKLDFDLLSRMMKTSLIDRDMDNAADIFDLILHEDNRTPLKIWIDKEMYPMAFHGALGRLLQGEVHFWEAMNLIDHILLYGDERVCKKLLQAEEKFNIHKSSIQHLSIAILGVNTAALKVLFPACKNNLKSSSALDLWSRRGEFQFLISDEQSGEVNLRHLFPKTVFTLPLAFFSSWVPNTEVSRIFSTLDASNTSAPDLPDPRGLSTKCPEVWEFHGNKDNSLFLAVIGGNQYMASKLYAQSSLLDKTELLSILAILIIKPASEPVSLTLCQDLKSHGAQFWSLDVGEVLVVALQYSSESERDLKAFSRAKFMRRIGFCLDLGVSPKSMMHVIECHKIFLQRMSGRYLHDNILFMILECGIWINEKNVPNQQELDELLLPELADTMRDFFQDRIVETAELRSTTWKTHRDILFAWMLEHIDNLYPALKSLISSEPDFKTHLSAIVEPIQSFSDFLGVWSTWQSQKPKLALTDSDFDSFLNTDEEFPTITDYDIDFFLKTDAQSPPEFRFNFD